MCDLETSRIGAPYIYDISSLRVNTIDSPNDEHMGSSKHVENWNKYILKKNLLQVS